MDSGFFGLKGLPMIAQAFSLGLSRNWIPVPERDTHMSAMQAHPYMCAFQAQETKNELQPRLKAWAIM